MLVKQGGASLACQGHILYLLLLSIVLASFNFSIFCRAQETDNSENKSRVKQSVKTVNPDTTPVMHAVHTDSPPVIDGILDETCWDDAAVITEFTQVSPNEGDAPSQLTKVHLLYDSDNIYVGVMCYDDNTTNIMASQMQRDARLGSDDSIAISFDTYHDHRNGYFFQTNPLGAKRDGMIEDNRLFMLEWDGIWYVESEVIDDVGWSTEFAIPLKTLNFDQNADTWGFNVQRFIQRNNETIRWASPYRNVLSKHVTGFGNLSNLHDLKQGLGLDIKPFMSTKFRDYSDATSNEPDGLAFEPGVDVFYKITPSLTAAFTVNTDFAETEVDTRQVNLTRFPLFFPEKRDFFLQDAGIFSFGGITTTPLPFFSRRIGVSSKGETIDIIAGAKLTGRIDRLSVGLINVQVDDFNDLNSTNLSVGRVSYQYKGESTIGGIFTYGDPANNNHNGLVGFDYNYRNSKFRGRNTLEGHAWVMKTSSPDTDDRQMAFGGSLSYPNDRVNWSLYAGQIDRDFNPALGFVKRSSIREYNGSYRYRWRPGKKMLQLIDLSGDFLLVTNLDGDIESQAIGLPELALENKDGDNIQFGISYEREQLFSPFRISKGVTIPVGDYHHDRYHASLSTSIRRPVSLVAEFTSGEFYSGDRTDTRVGMEWRPNPNFLAGFDLFQNDVRLEEGKFTTKIGLARVNVTFNPKLSWNNVLQYDNVSNTVGINSRIKWTVDPGNDIYFVLNQGFDVDGSSYNSTTSELAAKVTWTLRF